MHQQLLAYKVINQNLLSCVRFCFSFKIKLATVTF